MATVCRATQARENITLHFTITKSITFQFEINVLPAHIINIFESQGHWNYLQNCDGDKYDGKDYCTIAENKAGARGV